MSSVYPKKIQRAISSLIKKKLNFDRLSSKNVYTLIKYNIFANLPVKYYDFAVGIDINNILAFEENIIKISDITNC